MYLKEAETANQDIYDDFKFQKNNFGLYGLNRNISAL